MTSRAEIKQNAKKLVSENYWPAVGLLGLALAIIYACVVPAVLLPGLGSVAVYLVATVVTVGFCGVFVRIWRQEAFGVGMLFRPFSRYGRVLGGMMWEVLWLLLWSLLFVIPFTVFFTLAVVSMPALHMGAIWNHWALWRELSVTNNVFWVLAWCSFALLIPTIIKSYSYYMTQYVLATHPDVPATKALELSKKMMDGHKGRLFVAQLSFIGWFLLSGLTFGVLYIFYVGPYYQAAMAGYYDEIVKDALRRGVLTEAELSGEAWKKQEA